MEYRDVILEDSPVGYWNLNETYAGDLSNAVLAEASGSTPLRIGVDSEGLSLTDGLGYSKLGSGISFSGVSGESAISASSIPVPLLSYEAWVMWNSETTQSMIGVVTNHTFSGNSYNIAVSIDVTTRRLRISAGYGDGTRTTSIYLGSNDTLTPDTPHHVVVTYDQATRELIGYVDGIAVGSQVLTKPVAFNPQTVAIGQWSPGYGGYPYHGVIDEVAVYDTVLTPSRVYTHYAAGLPLNVPSNVTITPLLGGLTLDNFEVPNAEAYNVRVSKVETMVSETYEELVSEDGERIVAESKWITPTVVDVYIVTEDGDSIITESGVELIAEEGEYSWS